MSEERERLTTQIIDAIVYDIPRSRGMLRQCLKDADMDTLRGVDGALKSGEFDIEIERGDT